MNVKLANLEPFSLNELVRLRSHNLGKGHIEAKNLLACHDRPRNLMGTIETQT